MNLKQAKRQTAERDGYPDVRCQVCNGRADDPAHILPRGRFPDLRADPRNIVWLCRKCHTAHETREGRVALLELMRERYRYEYGPEYGEYLR